MQATKRQVLTALAVGLVLILAGIASLVAAFRGEVVDEWVGFGLVSVATFIIGGMLVRAAFLEVMDAVEG